MALISVGACSGLDPLTTTPSFQWLGTFGWWDERHIEWSPDGSRIIYSDGPGLYSVDVKGGSRRVLIDPVVNFGVDEAPWRDWLRMLHFDVSPDGSKIAYSTCRYSGSTDVVASSGTPFCKEGYEVVTSNLDGSDVVRLTSNGHLDNFPEWSPNGKNIAYIADQRPSDHIGTWSDSWGVRGRLLIHTLATGRTIDVTSAIGNRVAPHPPAWSPDGRLIAFVVYEDHEFDMPDREYLHGSTVRRRVVYTVAPDGSNLTRVSDTFSEPSWSADSQRLALAVPNRESDRGVHLYTFAPDGSQAALVTEITDALGSLWLDKPFWMGKVHWSPDGSRILFTKPEVHPAWKHMTSRRCWVCVATVNGSRVLEAAPFYTSSIFDDRTRFIFDPSGTSHRVADLLAWSPDGSSIAVLPRGQELLYTIDRNGNDPRILLPPGEAERSREEIGEACSDSVIIANPEETPGLVEDCRILLHSRYALGGAVLNRWNPHTPITHWGPVRANSSETLWVRLSGTPPRVTSIVIKGNPEDEDRTYLFGQIPPEFGSLQKLKTLDLSSNWLIQGIPPKLGNLSSLETLNLNGNLYMTGSLPAELGQLKNLRVMNLGWTGLTGTIPPEFGNLSNLETLNLRRTDISGTIPPELGNLTKLRVLDLASSKVSGTLPGELGNLVELETLDLAGTDLHGQLPPELGKLRNLHNLRLDKGDFSGCVPVELAWIWVEESGLPRCNLSEGEDS